MMRSLDPIYGRILIVDSNPISQKKIIDYLEDTGFLVCSAATQEAALNIFREQKPDLVLMDVSLDILEVINIESPEMPVIIFSEKEALTNVVSALRLGAWDYIVEPTKHLNLVERSICKALERTRLIQENRMYRVALESANERLSQNLKTLEVDQEAGRQLQIQLLPPAAYSFDSYEFQYKIVPSLYLSGDVIDYFKISDTLFGFYIADVSGHGASSAFVTVMLKSWIQMKAQSMITQPDAVLKMLSEELFQAKLGKYLTMIYGVLDTQNNVLFYSTGGHYPQPILYNEKNFKIAEYLQGEGCAVGLFENTSYKKYEVKLPEAFSLLMYSDGILEILPGTDSEENEMILLKKSSDAALNSSNVLERFGMSTEHIVASMPDDIAFLLLKKGNKNK